MPRTTTNSGVDRWWQRPVITTGVILALALLGVMAALVATRMGAGLSPDSVYYIASARSLLGGYGLSVPAAAGQPHPLVRFPPLYPLLLAFSGLIAGDPLGGARFVNALLLGANVFLVGHVIREYTNGANLPAVLGALLVLLQVDMLQLHAMAWSEPLFILLSVLSLWLLAKYFDTDARRFLIGSGLAMSLAWLTRYAAPPLVITGVVGLIAFRRDSLRARAGRALVLLVLFCAPMGLWMVRNVGLGGAPTGRELAYHPITLNHVAEVEQAVRSWVLPLWAFALGHKKRALAALAVSICAAVAVCRSRGLRTTLVRPSQPTALRNLPWLLGIYIVSYVGFLVVSISFFDFATPLDVRLLSPVYVCTVLLAMTWGYRLLSGALDGPGTKAVLVSVSILLVAAYLDTGVYWLGQVANAGQGYANASWTQSATIRQLTAAYPDRLIFSNGPDAIYIVSDRAADLIPRKMDDGSGKENPNYRAELDAMRARLETQRAVLVYLSGIPPREDLPSEAELLDRLPLTVLSRQDDGTIYGIASEHGD